MNFIKNIAAAVAMGMIASAAAASQLPYTGHFSIGNQDYYLHLIRHHDMSAVELSPAKYGYTQNIAADSKYIYLADHVANNSNQLVIKRFNAADGTPAEDLRIDETDLYDYYFDMLTDEERCFYLVDCHDEDRLILFLNPPAEGIYAGSSMKIYFYLIGKDGKIEREYCIDRLPGSDFPAKCISDFGIPEITGSPAAGDFELFLPMNDYYGNLMIARYVFESGKISSYSSVFYDDSVAYCKTTVKIVGGGNMIVDDYMTAPTLYSYRYVNRSYGSLGNHVKAQGCRPFEFDGHSLLFTGDIYTSDGTLASAVTQLNIGQWESGAQTLRSRAAVTDSDTADGFSDYRHLASLQFGPSTVSANAPAPYAYSQQMALTEYSATLKHLHFYVPGEFLATYQLSKSDNVTDIAAIEYPESGAPGFTISGGKITFDTPSGNVNIYSITGAAVYASQHPVTAIDISNFPKGIYIIRTTSTAAKIIL